MSDKPKTAKTLKPGDIIALFGIHNPTNERYVIYGEVIRFEKGKEIALVQTVREMKNKEIKAIERLIKLDEWGIMAILKFANWDRSVLFKEQSDNVKTKKVD